MTLAASFGLRLCYTLAHRVQFAGLKSGPERADAKEMTR